MGSPQCGNGRATAEADKIAEVSIGAKAEFFREMAGRAWAEIAGAGAEKKCVDFCGVETCFADGFFQSDGGEIRCLALEGMVELLCIHFENRQQIWGGELTLGDAGAVVVQDFFKQ